MKDKQISFDQVFLSWLKDEAMQIEGRDILPVAKSKGFNSIAEWRLATAIRLGMDTKEWTVEEIKDPNAELPNIIVGPYQGWSKFFNNELNTTFAAALEIPEFLEWCSSHDRIIPISQNFPSSTMLTLFRKDNGDLIHIEGGHRICAAAYMKKIGQPINFDSQFSVNAAIAPINDEEIENLKGFLSKGTFRNNI